MNIDQILTYFDTYNRAGGGKFKASPLYCSKGHEYTEDNLRFTTRKRKRKDGSIKTSPIRYCRICNTEKNRKIRQENPGKAAEYLRSRHKQLRKESINAYGGFCVCCKESTPEFLHLDHVNNDGANHRREVGGGADKMLSWAKKNNWPNTLQLKCHNCGMAEGFYGQCPHEKEGDCN